MKKDVKPGRRWRSFLLHIVSPAVVAIGLFHVAIFFVVLPAMENAIVERKKEMIKELTLAIQSDLLDLDRQEKAGMLSREAAQQQALQRVERVRYGDESKDYFWVTDLHPTMIMHPYRKDLNGKDVSHYSDPAGKQLFSEFVKEVRLHGDGYVDYLWQWKDDASRVVPKLSYVRLFEPWGWIVGTGIYLEDVRDEISRMTRRVILISFLISLVIAALLLYIARQGLELERQRLRAEQALRESEEKYRLLVESNNEGIALTVDERIVYANGTLLEMLGYAPQEIARKTIGEVWSRWSASREGAPGGIPDHTFVTTKDGDPLDVIATVSDVTFAGRDAHIVTFKDISRHDRTDETLAELVGELQESLLMPNTPLSQWATKLVDCDITTPIRKAAATMARVGSDAIVVRAPGGEHVGIVTDRDLRERVLLGGIDADAPISTVMTAPLLRAPQKTLLYEASLLLLEKGLHHLAVTDEDGRVTGMISTDEVLQAQRHPASILIKGVREARTPEEVFRCRRSLPSLVRALLESGAKVEGVTRILASVSDAITTRLIDLAIDELGHPPARFSFVAFGSAARGEQTLATDQDNGILYADPEPGKAEETAAYFLRLGERVCGWLDEAGYAFCKGEVMARNPKWCKPISQWLDAFAECVAAPDPKEVLDVNVFFDFRSIHGDEELVRRLRRRLSESLDGRQAFFFHLAQATLQYKPPLGFFGNIQNDSADGHAPAFNIKSAMVPIVNFARIYALRDHVEEQGTLARLRALLKAGALVESSHEELVQAFEYLLQMRLLHQGRQIGRGEPPDNLVALRGLTQIERSLLTKIFSDILVFQSRVGWDFARTT